MTIKFTKEDIASGEALYERWRRTSESGWSNLSIGFQHRWCALAKDILPPAVHVPSFRIADDPLPEGEMKWTATATEQPPEAPNPSAKAWQDEPPEPAETDDEVATNGVAVVTGATLGTLALRHDALRRETDARLQRVKSTLRNHEAWHDGASERFDAVDRSVAKHDDALEDIVNRLDAHAAKLASLEKALAVRHAPPDAAPGAWF